MGEVGAVIPEKPTESPLSTTVNGEVNGLCKDSDEPMDVDADDSQASSENGLADSASESNSVSKLPIVSKTDSLVASKPVDLPATNEIVDDKEDVTQSEENSQPISEENEDASRDQSSLPDAQEIEDTEEENSQAESQVSPENGDSQDVDGPAKEDTSSQDNNDVEMTEESNSRENTIEENSQSSSHSEKSDKSDEVKENGEKDDVSVGQTKEPMTEDVNSQSSVNKSSTVDESTKENGEVNGSKKEKPSLNISDDITIIESDDDDEPKSSTEPDEKASNLVKNLAASKAVTTTAPKQANVPAKPPLQVDDDAPVIIPSDSESEDESSKKQETPAPTESLDLSMKPSQPDEDMSGDDCVVIEDDDRKEKDPLSITPIQRNSLIRSREIDDDDIAEIVHGDLPPSKRSRNSNSPSVNSSQYGQITIKDARSLMPNSFQDSLPKSYQQQFAQQMLGGKGGKEAPGLVVIDTNSLLKPGLTAPNANKGGVTITNVMPNPQGIFPNNIRPGLAPLAPPKLVPTSGGVSLPVSNPTLLPALTDDMFVLEAPSFIVPYIYEKPPEENLKEVVTKLEAEIEKIKKELKKSEKEDDNKKGAGETITGDSVDASSGSKSGEKKKKKKKSEKNPDDSWDELDTSTDDEASDGESRTKVLIKDSNPDLDTMKSVLTPDGGSATAAKSSSSPVDDKKSDPKSENYFESPLGKFFIDIGINLVQEYVQTDLLRMQKRKLSKSMKSVTAETELGIRSLQKNIEASKKRNEPFKFEMKRCEYCNFKSESALSMAHHYETPHMRQYLYKCNFCPYETRPAHDILFHMEAVHNIKGRLEKALAYNQCPNCPFEENGKSKFARHIPVCAKKFRPDINLNPPHDWEAPAKIPRIKPRHGLVGTATAYQAMAAQAAAQKAQLAAMAARAAAPTNTTPRSRGNRSQNPARLQPNPVAAIRNTTPIRAIPGVVLPNNYQISGGQIIQQQQQQQNSKKSSGQQPSISITPLPRQPGNVPSPMSLAAAAAMPPKPQIAAGMKPGQAPTGGNKASFVICEICDGYIKDLEQLRNHMQWMHKVKIHPKMIHNRPPLNCQKCQYRFFTDQGLERHLLGSHGLVTSSMQEAANKGKDAGRCPVCGRMYQWKLLNHVSRDHHMTLKPAHLSYKCTVCTATFGMYKQFENHVYTAHSTVAKKAMDGKKSNNNSMSGSSNSPGMAGGSSGTMISGLTITNAKSLANAASLSSISSGDSLLKPLKINDEITIIPQPASKSRNSMQNDYESHIIGKSISRR